MILLVLTCGFALGATAADLPTPYLQLVEDILRAEATLTHSVLSMKGDIPLLTDYRRHFARIINVVLDEGELQSGCFLPDYYGEYQKNVNKSSIEGISNPEGVILKVQKLIDDVNNNTNLIVDLINNLNKTPLFDFNQRVQAILEEKDDATFKYQTDVFLTAAEAAYHLNEHHKKLDDISRKLDEERFIILGAETLETAVRSLGNLYGVLHQHYLRC